MLKKNSCSLLLLLVIGSSVVANAGSFEPYYQLNLGLASSLSGKLKDENTSAQSPGAVFGKDSIAPGGDMGRSAVIGAAIGIRLNPFWRTEVAMNYYPSFILKADSNFADANKISQPTRADASALTVHFSGFYDFKAKGRVKPYIGAGLGFSKNTLSKVSITIPKYNSGNHGSLSYEGDTVTQLSYMLSVGTRIQIKEDTLLDARFSYVDFGKFKTLSGAMLHSVVYKPDFKTKVRDVTIPVATTEYSLRTYVFTLGLQKTF